MIWNYYHFQKKINFLKNQHTFKNLYLFQNYKKNTSCTWTIIMAPDHGIVFLNICYMHVENCCGCVHVAWGT
jgi:hypothetical protein